MPTDNSLSNVPGYTTHEIIPGINLMAHDDADEDRVGRLVRECKVIALGRAAVLARIKECIAKLVEIDNDEADGLVHLAEAIGWNACRTDVTAEEYRLVVLAVLDTLDTARLATVLDTAEYSLSGGAS